MGKQPVLLGDHVPQTGGEMRRVPVHLQEKNGLGRKLCLVCKTPVPPRRSSYCSNECWLRNNPGMIRRRVETRDKGVCAGCGVQCQWRDHPLRWEDRKAYRLLPRWEADHITPVVEGGGLCGVDGYRTLCRACHKSETAQLAARRAMRRRESNESLFLSSPTARGQA